MKEEKLQCENYNKTLFMIEKRWYGKLFTIMRCHSYTDKKNIMAGWHTFYESEEDFENDNHDLVAQCPSYIQHLRDKKADKKKVK